MRRLSRAGFERDFVRTVILPDWWDDDCERDPSLLADIEVRVARFLQAPISSIRDPRIGLTAPAHAGVQLRRVRDSDPERLAPAIHSALQVARAVIRSLREPPRVRLPHADASVWRNEITQTGIALGLSGLLSDCWQRGIPVVPINLLPSPKFQAMACFVEDRPAVVLGHKHDEPGRVAFLVGHEIGHVAAGDCKPERPVVDGDEEEAGPDDTDFERRADAYATRLLVGDVSLPTMAADTPMGLASRAAQIEEETGADAGTIVWTWARRTGRYRDAVTAIKALYRARGAQRLLQEHFFRFVDLAAASESDRALLDSVVGAWDQGAATDRQ
jgi:hypothetical protein